MRGGWKTSEEKDRYTEIALEHFNILTNIYSHNIFNLIYMVLEKSFESKDEYTNQWISLLIKCLRIEDTFYKEQVQKATQEMFLGILRLYHSRILERLHQNISPESLSMRQSIFLFPERN